MEHVAPEIRDAEYARVPDTGRRNLVAGRGLPSNADTRGPGRRPKGMHEEKEANTQRFIPDNYDIVGIPPVQVAMGAQRTSREFDSPFISQLQSHVQGPYDTTSIEANPPPGYQRGPVAPERGPYEPCEPMPAHRQYRGDAYIESVTPPTPRSRSPPRTSHPSDKYRIREHQWKDYNYDHYPPPRRRHSNRKQRRDIYNLDALGKRDGLEQINAQESQAASSTGPNPDIQAQQDYAALLIIFDEVKSNATDLLMPILAEMVDGHNSSLVWNAAWEIMSLADPSIIVAGPFMSGFSSLDYWEDQIRNKTDNATMTNIIAVHDVLYDLHSIYWHQAYYALNSTGYLQQIIYLQKLLITNDTILGAMNIDMSTTKGLNNWFGNYLSNPLCGLPCSMDNSTMGYRNNGTACAANETLFEEDFEAMDNGTSKRLF